MAFLSNTPLFTFNSFIGQNARLGTRNKNSADEAPKPPSKTNDREFGGREGRAAPVVKSNDGPREGLSPLGHAGNVAAQSGRAVSGAGQGALNLISAIPLAVESLGRGIAKGIGLNPSDEGMIAKGAREQTGRIDHWANTYVPAPQSQAAETAAKVSTAVGEAIPISGIAIASGGLGNALIGSGASWAAGGVQATGKELVQGSGNLGNALAAGVSESAASIIGGKVAGALTAGIGSKALAWGAESLGEGAEEVLGGVLQSGITGDKYTLGQAAEDFAMGAAVGGIIGGAVQGVNAAQSEIATMKTVHDIRSGRGGGALEGLTKSVEIAKADPGTYGDIARALAKPAQETVFDTARLKDYVKSAVDASGTSQVVVPSNIDKVSARNVGSYHTIYDSGSRDPNWGMNQAASVLESAQIGKGLSPRQSGNVLRAVLETNSQLYSEMGKIGGDSSAATSSVNIERGADYRSALPTPGLNNNYTVTDVQGRAAQNANTDAPINVFRGMPSEWVIPTMKAGEFVVPNSSPTTSSDTPALFGRAPGQMLGAGLYLTSVPSKADQYSSGVQSDISLQGSDSAGIMANSPIFGATTFVNSADLSAAIRGAESDTVKTGRVGQEAELANFINDNQANSDAAVIYSKFGDDYTEIVRPDATTTQIERLYMPKANTDTDAAAAIRALKDGASDSTSTADKNSKASDLPSAIDMGKAQAQAQAVALNNGSTDSARVIGNAEIDTLLDKNVPDNITVDNISGKVNDERETKLRDKHEERKGIAADTMRSSSEIGQPSQKAQEGGEVAPISTLELRTPELSVDLTGAKEANVPLASEAEMSNEQLSTDPDPDLPIISGPELNLTPLPDPPGVREVDTATGGRAIPHDAVAAKVWTPVQTMVEEAQIRRKRDRDVPEYDFNVVRGQGFQGKIQETSGYKQSIGGLSSY